MRGDLCNKPASSHDNRYQGRMQVEAEGSWLPNYSDVLSEREEVQKEKLEQKLVGLGQQICVAQHVFE